MNNWNLSYLLKDLIKTRANPVGEVRQEVWASEIGMPYLDRYLDMKGVPYTNLPDGKALANFFLGEQIESGLKQMLENIGIAYTDNERVVYQQKDLLGVVAKPDLIVEINDWEKIKENIKTEAENLPDDKYKEREKNKLREKYKTIIQFQERYPEGLKKTIFEIKSANTNSFKMIKKEGAKLHHQLQLLTYLKAYNLPEGHIIYINKEYGDMNEFVIRADNENLNELWNIDIETMTFYIKNDIKPELEFYASDWRYKYSKYYDLLYKELYEREK